MKEVFGAEAYSPREIASKVEEVGVAKARLPLLSTFALGVLAGGFISLGALFYTLVVSDPALPFAVSRVLGGAVFSLGLVLVVIAGAELFTGNNLMVMALVSRRISLSELGRNLGVVYLGNIIGAVGLAVLVHLSGHFQMNGGAVGETAIRIAEGKTGIPFAEAFFRGVLCNMLVCLAVWLTFAGRGVADKIAALFLPITAFVAAGFEHCVANFYFLAVGIFEGGAVSVSGLLGNLIPVTLGNIVGGSVLVGMVYWLIYQRMPRDDKK